MDLGGHCTSTASPERLIRPSFASLDCIETTNRSVIAQPNPEGRPEGEQFRPTAHATHGVVGGSGSRIRLRRSEMTVRMSSTQRKDDAVSVHRHSDRGR